MTRCKEGELAFVLSEECAGHIPSGHVVKCLHYYATSNWLNSDGSVDSVCRGIWHVEYNGRNRGSIGMYGVRDVNLWPIRDPGPDEVDEMVKLLGVPGERAPVMVGMGVES